MWHLTCKRFWLLLCVVSQLIVVASVRADQYYWNTWQTRQQGHIQLPHGPIEISFSTTNFHELESNYPSWQPVNSFADGVIVDNGPVATNGIIKLIGGTGFVNTLMFSTPVVDPVIAIWSLGRVNGEAFFDFDQMPILVSGGPNLEFGGSSLVVNGRLVSGREGNGTLQFQGVYSSISWTNPVNENWYGFNVGAKNSVPEPSVFGLVILMGALFTTRRYKS